MLIIELDFEDLEMQKVGENKRTIQSSLANLVTQFIRNNSEKPKIIYVGINISSSLYCSIYEPDFKKISKIDHKLGRFSGIDIHLDTSLNPNIVVMTNQKEYMSIMRKNKLKKINGNS